MCTDTWDSSNNNSNCSTNKTTNKPLDICVIFNVPESGEGTSDSNFHLHPQYTVEGLVLHTCTSKPKINPLILEKHAWQPYWARWWFYGAMGWQHLIQFFHIRSHILASGSLASQSPAELHHTSGLWGMSCFGGRGEGTSHCDATEPSQDSSLARDRDLSLILLIAGGGCGRCSGCSAHLAVPREVSAKVNSRAEPLLVAGR